MSLWKQITNEPAETVEYAVARVSSRLPSRIADQVWGRLLRRSIEAGRWHLVPDEQLERHYRAAVDELSLRDTSATYLEFGVFTGSSFGLMARIANEESVDLRLFGFDSFRGLPSSVRNDEGGWKPGSFYCPEWVTRWNLETRHGLTPDRYQLVPGWFDETLTDELAERLEIDTVDIAMLDADAYSSTVPVLTWLTDRLADRCVLIFDDWFWGSEQGETSGVERAFTEWSGANDRFDVESMGTYSVDDPTRPDGRRLAGNVVLLTRR